MNRTVRLVSVFSAAMFFAAPSFAAETAGPEAFLTPREKLSTQASDPFLFVWKVMDETQPRWDEFEGALERFPTTSSCLLPEERGKEVQSLLAFDWQAMSRTHEMEICMFRIFHSLTSHEYIDDWLRYFHFSVVPIQTSGLTDRSNQWRLYGKWSAKKYFGMTGASEPWFRSPFGASVRSFILAVALDDKFRVTRVNFDGYGK